VRKWYEPKDSAAKVMIMGAFLLGASLLVFASSCADLWVYVACTVSGAKELATTLGVALVFNQTTYQFSVRPFKSAASPAA
jgi:hypothetical protein